MKRQLVTAPLRGRWARYFLIGLFVGAAVLFVPWIRRDGACIDYLVSIWDLLHGR